MRPEKTRAIVIGVLGGICLVVAIIASLAYYGRYHTLAPVNACISNLVQIDGAKQQWAKANNKGPTDVPTWKDIAPYFGRGNDPNPPKCWESGVYTIGAVSEAPTCSIKGHELK